MKRFYQLFLLVQVAVVSVLIVTTLAPVQAEETDFIKDDRCAHCKIDIRKELRVHLDYYYELLADKFVPNETKRWHEIRHERDLLRKRLKEAEQKGELKHDNVDNTEWLARHNELQESFHYAVEKRNQEKLKILMPQLFDHYEELNKLYKERLQITTSRQEAP